jgi:hypothetical protein
MRFDAVAADDRRHAQANIADVVRALHERGDRQQRFFIEQNGVDDIADGDAHGPTRAAFAFDHFGAAAFGALEDRVLEGGRAFGQARQRQAVDGGAGPDRNHRIAVLAQDQRLDLRRGQLEFLGDERTETRGVKHRAQAINLVPGQAGAPQGQLREDIDGIGNNENVRVLAQTGDFDRRQ